MKRLIIYFLIILGSIWLGLKVYEQPGYILVLYQHWAIETTMWFLCLLLLLAFFIFHLLLNLLRGTVFLPTRIEHWWQARQQQKAIKRLNKGYCDLLKGKWKKAEKELVKSAKYKELSFIDYALAAQAADSGDAIERRDLYLRRAKENSEKNSYAADILLIQFLLKHNQPEEALTLLINLREERPKDPYLLRLLAETYVQLHDWFHLQTILHDIKKYKVFNDEEYIAIEKEAYLHSLKDHFFTDFSQVQVLWNKMPKYLRHDPDIIIAYATHLNRWNRSSEAEELVRKELKKSFSNSLMEYYVTTRSEEPAKQLALGEAYLKTNADAPASLRAMGILCLRNRLWGQARDYLEKSLKLQPIAETYTALGFVYEKLGENEKALNYYRKGLNYLAPL